NFPVNPQYKFDRNSARNLDENFSAFLFRMAYLSKKNTKSGGDGYRNFGTSQLNRTEH
ncbi:TPA: YagK/YfjJ domain-containing protein, partial [Aeromonas hydrophila]